MSHTTIAIAVLGLLSICAGLMGYPYARWTFFIIQMGLAIEFMINHRKFMTRIKHINHIGEILMEKENDWLADNVFGITSGTAHKFYIHFIAADKPGNGDVGRYLDDLKTKHRVIIVPCIMDLRPVLEGMLLRRGFKLKKDYVPHLKQKIYVYEFKQSLSIIRKGD